MNICARFIVLLASCKEGEIKRKMFLKCLNVIKEMVSVQRATVELWMHLEGLLSTQEARVALGFIASCDS